MKYLISLLILAIAIGGYVYPISVEQRLPNYDEYIRDLIDNYVQESERQIASALDNALENLLSAPSENLGADTVLPVAGTTYTLSGSGVSSSATSLTLSTLTLTQTGQKLLDADFSTTFYVTLEPGNRTRQEVVSCTTVVQNAAGTATLSGCSRGLSPITPYTASTTLQFAHSGGSQIIFSNPPQLYNQFTAKANDETITGIWAFPTPTASTEAATKGYVDGGILAGAATSTEGVTGIVRLATALQAASSTPTTANTPYVMQAQYATDTPQYGCATGYTGTAGAGCSVIASLAGKIKQAWLDLTASFTWTGNHTFSGATTTVTGVFGVGTTSPYTIMGVTGELVANNFTATSTNATSTFQNLRVVTNATTTNLVISGTQEGGATKYTASSTAFSCASGTCTYTGSAPTAANIAVGNWEANDGGVLFRGDVTFFRTGKTSSSVMGQDTNAAANSDFSYTTSWSGANLVIVEDADESSDTSISGTIYWYQ